MTSRLVLLLACAALAHGFAIDGTQENAENVNHSGVAPRGGSYAFINGKEYFISDDADQIDFAEATTICEGMGKKLLSLETSAENSMIVQYCLDHSCYLRYIWTSAVKETNRIWHWGNGEQVAFFDWAFQQPDNRAGETALVMYPAEGWHDTAPTSKYFNYICE